MPPPLDRPYYGAPWGVAIARFFRKYATFRGRASPSEFWWWVLASVLVGTALNVLGASTGAEEWSSPGLGFGTGPVGPITSIPGVLSLVWSLGTVLPGLALTWRRLHDTDRSGAWFFLILVPLVGPFVLLVFLLGGPRVDGQRFD